MAQPSSTATRQPSSPERTVRLNAISGAFLAFADMMKKDYGISKEVALLAMAAAYDTNAEDKS